MSTTLTATPQPATASVLLEVTTDVYPTRLLDLDAADIVAEASSPGPWTDATYTYTGVTLSGGAAYFSGTTGTVDRNLSGLTVGTEYELALTVQQYTRPATVKVGGAATLGTATVSEGDDAQTVRLRFTATATAMWVRVSSTSDIPGLIALVLESVLPAYAFTLTRSDANGTRQVRLRDGEAPVGGALLVTDYEPALTGTITYTVTTTDTVTASTTLADRYTTERDVLGTRTNRAITPHPTASDWLASLAGGTATHSVESTGGPAGVLESWRRYVFTAAPTSTGMALFAGGATTATKAAVTPGETITVSAWGIASKALTARLLVYWFAADGSALTSPVFTDGGYTPFAAGQWFRRSVTAEVPAGAAYCRGHVYFSQNVGTIGVGDYLGATAALVESGATLLDWFSGASPDAAWSGPVNGSSSTLTLYSAPYELLHPGVHEPRLHVPVMPNYTVGFDLATGYDAAVLSTSVRHDVIGRPDPLYNLGVASMRAGTLTIWCPDYAAAAEVLGIYSRAQVVMLRQADHPGLDMYHVLDGAARVTPVEADRWTVSVDYQEVRPPAAPLAGALGWTYADSTARHATYQASALEFPTYGDLYVGPA